MKKKKVKKKRVAKEASPDVELPHRLTKLTPEVQKQIIKILTNCGTIEDACYVVGIRKQTLYGWRKRGMEEKSGIYRTFLDCLERALVVRRLARESSVLEAGKKDWRATMAIMAVTEPLRYAPRITIKVTEEINHAAQRLEEAFANEPELLERAISAIAGGNSSGETSEEDGGAEGQNHPGGEAVQPPQAKPEAGDLPKA